MAAGMKILELFPVFELNEGRSAQIMASLDRRKIRKSHMRPGQVSAKQFAHAMLNMICCERKAGRSKDAVAAIKSFLGFCTIKTFMLMASYAQEDLSTAATAGLPLDCRSQKRKRSRLGS